ncbi:MAG TPA: glycosyltransferase [Gemmatimonadales bacterium]|nr:glycosyltransferase [Gemmatimonadales bacterium]
MRRVLLVSHTYVDPASRGKLVALAARDLDLTVGVPQRWVEPGLGRPIETTWERKNGVEVFPIPTRDPGHPEESRFGRRALLALLRDKRPDLVQVEEEPTSRAARQVIALAGKLGLPVVLHTRNRGEPPLPVMGRWRRRRALRRLKGATAESEAAAELVRRDAPDLPVTVVPQLGVPVPHAPEHVPHEGLAIGFVGRLVPEKGLDTLLLALGRLRSEAWHLVVAGDGPDRERLEQLASDLRLAARVRWTGALPRDRLQGLWAELDVLVAPARAAAARTELTGHLVLEAMAYEVAAVGSDVGVLPEVIGDAGLVVAPGDDGALARALVDLTDPAFRRPLAARGRARVMQQYSDDAVAERTVAFWRELVR